MSKKPLAKLSIKTIDGVETLVSDRPMYRQGPPGIFGPLGPEGSIVLEVRGGWASFSLEELVAIARGEA